MLLGKRPRPPVMRRTTSMSGGMAVDMQVSNLEPHEEQMMPDNNTLHLQGEGDGDDGIKDPHHAVPMGHDQGLMVVVPDQPKNNVLGSIEYQYDERLLGMVVSPSHITTNISTHHSQNQTNNNPPPHHHVIHTPHFLRTCGLCKCPLAPGRDIYMYRGDTAFCSLECREQQMKQDSRKEKWKMASNKEEHRASPRTAATATATATAKASTKSEAAACT